MRIPKRKPGKYAFTKADTAMTQAKFDELKSELLRLTTASQPHAITEMQRLAELGDFSENAAYQMAKGKLRGINDRMLVLENTLKHADIIIPSGDASSVQLGSTVTVELDGAQRTYTILGSAETDPLKGIISHNSPIGSALMGRRIGEKFTVKIKDEPKGCTILKIA